jgi:hypothetical protein
LSTWNTILWQQFGAAIDMLENAMLACPEELWSDRSERPEFWYVVYHTLFFLDFYLVDSVEGFAPPAPVNLDELDPAGLLPSGPTRKTSFRPMWTMAAGSAKRRSKPSRTRGLSGDTRPNGTR